MFRGSQWFWLALIGLAGGCCQSSTCPDCPLNDASPAKTQESKKMPGVPPTKASSGRRPTPSGKKRSRRSSTA